MKTAREVVRSARFWADLTNILTQQALHTKRISFAIQENNFESVKAHLVELARLVQKRRPAIEQLAPAIQELMGELFPNDDEDTT